MAPYSASPRLAVWVPLDREKTKALPLPPSLHAHKLVTRIPPPKTPLSSHPPPLHYHGGTACLCSSALLRTPRSPTPTRGVAKIHRSAYSSLATSPPAAAV